MRLFKLLALLFNPEKEWWAPQTILLIQVIDLILLITEILVLYSQISH